MQVYKADLHVHTVLSPCGSLEMNPVRVVEEACRKKIDILGITDHNSTRHAPLIKSLAEKKGIFVVCGAEVTTREEIHCLSFFENPEELQHFQDYLDVHIRGVRNKPELFGYQVIVDEYEQILEEVDTLLISALDQGIDQVEQKVHALNGLFIPAHIDRRRYSLISQLGFVPRGIRADALEITGQIAQDELLGHYPYLETYSFIKSSDAHHPDQLGQRTTLFHMQSVSFQEIRMALKGINNRMVSITHNPE